MLMPELPEVEIFRRYFNRNALHQKIKNARVESRRIIKEISPRSLTKKLKGEEFKSTGRHGKYLFANINKDAHLVFHFGMTGSLKYFKNKDDSPRYVRFLINFANGNQLAYNDPRKFGSIHFVKNADEFIKRKNLGVDPFNKNFKYSDFKKLLKKKKGTIKSIFMDQKILAGIGNIYSDEIFFQCSVYPGKGMTEISEQKLKEMFNTMKRVLKKAVAYKVDPENFPDNYLLFYRKNNSDCPKCGGKIKRKTIAGRSSYFCSKHQK